jgi:hypothetical protein
MENFSKATKWLKSEIACLRLTIQNGVLIQTLQFKDPTTSLIISLLGGSFGIDRFMIGDTGLGVGKLLTCGGFMNLGNYRLVYDYGCHP